MWKVTKRFEFDAAHRLLGYDGPCSRVHGHHYVVEVTVCGEELDELGMLLDFKELDFIVSGWTDHWDHRTLLCFGDPLNEHLEGMPLPSGQNPTAEVMARDLYREVKERIPSCVRVFRVRVYETPGCWCDYEG